jgi:hypothetical protein
MILNFPRDYKNITAINSRRLSTYRVVWRASWGDRPDPFAAFLRGGLRLRLVLRQPGRVLVDAKCDAVRMRVILEALQEAAPGGQALRNGGIA